MHKIISALYKVNFHNDLEVAKSLNPYPAKVIYLNFQPLEVVSRYRDPQPQVIENYSYLFETETFTNLAVHTVILSQ